MKLIAGVTVATFIALALFWRGLVAECLDPLYLRSVSRVGPPVHFIFLVLVVLNLVSGFQALGTLLAVGLMMLPAAAARFWVTQVWSLSVLAVAIGIGSCIAGLLISYHASLPSGPAIILSAGVFYVGSILVAPRGLRSGRTPRTSHRIA